MAFKNGLEIFLSVPNLVKGHYYITYADEYLYHIPLMLFTVTIIGHYVPSLTALQKVLLELVF